MKRRWTVLALVLAAFTVGACGADIVSSDAPSDPVRAATALGTWIAEGGCGGDPANVQSVSVMQGNYTETIGLVVLCTDGSTYGIDG